MSLNQFYNIFLLFNLFSILVGKILVPSSYTTYPETISKENRHREYYELNNDGLEYVVEGPVEIKFFSKAAYPKKTNNELKEFKFDIFVNGLKIAVDNYKKLDKKTFSSSHPMHIYTYSSKDVIVLPSGIHNIKIEKKTRFDFTPILIRAIKSRRKSKNIVKDEVNFAQDKRHREYNPSFQEYLIDNLKSTAMPLYYGLDATNPLFLDSQNSTNLFEINLRGLHSTTDDMHKIITMALNKNGKLNARYHILSVPHPVKVIADMDYIPSRLNKIYIKADSSYYELNIKTKNETLLVRANKVSDLKTKVILN